jgi:hypothetical protein
MVVLVVSHLIIFHPIFLVIPVTRVFLVLLNMLCGIVFIKD